ncbi:hypothetical protein AB5J56_06105 [Streptomyces sp. R21]|uniref:Uncharacterized protein n=1 Tax=Streptomyces sp. R21 TaxID=3238627 RepID=A0AB39P0U7_9ACTN
MIGAAPGEHSETRTTWRNGHRERLLTTQPTSPEPQITPQPESKPLP